MKKWFNISLILLLAAAVLACGALLSDDFDIKKFYAGEYEQAEYLCDAEVVSVKIYESSQDVEILPSADGECRLVYQIGENDDYRISLDNGCLSVERERKKVKLFDFDFVPERTMRLYLPAGEYESLHVSGASCDVLVKECAFGDVSIETASGDIEIAGCMADDINLSAVSGEIDLNGCTASGALLSTTSGDISLCLLNAENADISVTSGEVDILDSEISGDMEIESVSGDVEFDNLATGSMYVRTVSGDVEGILSGSMTYETRTASGTVRVPASIGNGGTCRIETTSGNISVREK